jgi:8-oxo-dGTP pyrophosphatase MutT (NUDIX family)
MTTDTIRDAATVILWRMGDAGPEVLMGQRGAGAAFMASKFVFPGGAVDADDHAVPLATPLPDTCHHRLQQETQVPPDAIAVAAIRELHEETGLAMAVPGGVDLPAPGLTPAAAALRFVFRAITPPGRTRRFDARFFLAPAQAIAGDSTDFTAASGELSHLEWIGLARARAYDLPFITEVVLAEVSVLLRGEVSGNGVPFFDNRTDRPAFRRLV